ncbi:MAG: MBL fold metallo-hydrolase [Xanthomonadaceae bacterium]|nr:MBL fold metallo-hydrolase [Xanthomonadaceae bacterium]
MRIEFWGAAQEVTGACFLLECGGYKVLVDCGMIQGRRRDELRNREPFPFDPATIDAVVLTHAHIDHSGRLPLLVKAGFRGKILTHRASRDLCEILLRDAAHLAAQDAELDNRKRARKGLPPVEPLFTTADVERTLQHLRALEYGERRQILPGIAIRLRDAGHILGSAIVEVWLSEGGLTRKLVFSGDLGHRGTPMLRDPELIDAADLVILESTYGDREHRSWESTWAEMAEIFTETRAGRGNILIPAFAVGRTQELLYSFHRHFDQWGLGRWQIFLDSPMAIQATQVYRRHDDLFDREASAMLARGEDPLKLPNLRLTPEPEDSMALNRIRAGAIIIAGSGMCEGGRIRHHFKHNIWREETQVLIVGFQAEGTLGRRLVDGARRIRLWGETMKVRAKIHTIGGLSAHAGQQGLFDWYANFDGRPPVCLVHGEPTAMETLARRLQDELTAEVLQPRLGAVLDLSQPLRKLTLQYPGERH